MGEHNVEQELDERNVHEFMQSLLADLRGLAFMLEDSRIESGVRRIGAEQEMLRCQMLVLSADYPLMIKRLFAVAGQESPKMGG